MGWEGSVASIPMDSPPQPPSRGEGGARWTGAACAVAGFLTAGSAAADEVLTFSGTVDASAPAHFTIPFEVPAGTNEIQIDHDDGDPDDILDWGLSSPSGFRGWGGGNDEPAIVSELAASRSYLTGPIEAGTWAVDVGKAKVVGGTAKVVGGTASYSVTVTLRDAPTLAPQPTRRPYAPAAALRTEARWYAGDFHVHSAESGDAAATFDEIVALAKSRGLDFVELSDHNTTSQLDFVTDVQSHAGSLLILPGVEFTTYAGHANGIGATAFVDHKFDPSAPAIRAAADAFHAQGALFALNHPALDIGDACIGCAWKHDLPSSEIDAIEIVTAGSAQIFYEPASRIWEELASQGAHVAAIGGSDDHRAGQDPGAFGTPIGSPTTMVFATELSAEGILTGIRNGRTVVKVRGPGDPMVELSELAQDERGTPAQIVARITGGAGLDVRFVVDGELGDVVTIDSDPFELTMEAAGAPGETHRYRVEVLEGVTPVTLTSHLWVTTPEPATGSNDTYAAGGGCSASAEAGPSWGGFALAIGVLAGAGGLMKRRRT